MVIVNTRSDLDALKGTPAYLEAMRLLAGTMTTTVDVAVYPEGYGLPGYSGPTVAPQWREIDTLATVERLGFTRDSLQAELAAVESGGG